MSVEKYTAKEKFDQLLTREVEHKYLPLFPEQLSTFREQAWPIEQFYLSHPSEPFSLRMREELKDGVLSYRATLKDRGQPTANGIDRMEITVDIPTELYLAYKTPDVPVLKKLRAEPLPGVTIDFYEDNSIQVESEDPEQWHAFIRDQGNLFVETTTDTLSSNEQRAHIAFRRAHDGQETLLPSNELSAEAIVEDILAQQLPITPTIVHIAGRSGSGKSTLVHELREKLAHSWAALDSVVLSTDDYHRGTNWLTAYNGGEPWTNWDEPIVYDTAAMAEDITRLMRRQSTAKREIDWSIAEPVITGVVSPAPVIIIEGIYASSPDISHLDDLQYEMNTGLATCIGRRLLRDLQERPEFADPAKSLRYMLEYAEPAYRDQQRART